MHDALVAVFLLLLLITRLLVLPLGLRGSLALALDNLLGHLNRGSSHVGSHRLGGTFVVELLRGGIVVCGAVFLVIVKLGAIDLGVLVGPALAPSPLPPHESLPRTSWKHSCIALNLSMQSTPLGSAVEKTKQLNAALKSSPLSPVLSAPGRKPR